MTDPPGKVPNPENTELARLPIGRKSDAGAREIPRFFAEN